MATAYVKKGKTMIALASWAKEAADCRLKIDWAAVGLNPARAVLTAPAIEEFQKAASFKPDDVIRMEPGKGWLLILEEG
jgi:leucyl aminopeptidase